MKKGKCWKPYEVAIHKKKEYWCCFSKLNFSFIYLSVEGALAHPYLNSLHDISDEPICTTPFNFDFEQHALTEEQMKELIYREAIAFNPEYQHMWKNWLIIVCGFYQCSVSVVDMYVIFVVYMMSIWKNKWMDPLWFRRLGELLI